MAEKSSASDEKRDEQHRAIMGRIDALESRFDEYKKKFETTLPKVGPDAHYGVQSVPGEARNSFNTDPLVKFMQSGGADALKALFTRGSVDLHGDLQTSVPELFVRRIGNRDRIGTDFENGVTLYNGSGASGYDYRPPKLSFVHTREPEPHAGKILEGMEAHLSYNENRLNELLEQGDGVQRVEDLPHGRLALARIKLNRIPQIDGIPPIFTDDIKHGNKYFPDPHLRELYEAFRKARGGEIETTRNFAIDMQVLPLFEESVGALADLADKKIASGLVLTRDTMDGFEEALSQARVAARKALGNADERNYFLAAAALNDPGSRAHMLMGGRIRVGGVKDTKQANTLLEGMSGAARGKIADLNNKLPPGQADALTRHPRALATLEADAAKPFFDFGDDTKSLMGSHTKGLNIELVDPENSAVAALEAKRATERDLDMLKLHMGTLLVTLDGLRPVSAIDPVILSQPNDQLALASLHQWKKEEYKDPLGGIISRLSKKIDGSDAKAIKDLLGANTTAKCIEDKLLSIRGRNPVHLDINDLVGSLNSSIDFTVSQSGLSTKRFIEQLDKGSVLPKTRENRGGGQAAAR